MRAAAYSSLRRNAVCGGVHALAPGPESIVLRLGAMFGAAANQPLKRVRMRVDQAWQDRSPAEPLRVR